jgi:hypothetical protein
MAVYREEYDTEDEYQIALMREEIFVRVQEYGVAQLIENDLYVSASIKTILRIVKETEHKYGRSYS